jgi:ethanolamine utilization protein EutQ (cupin superfamily)
MPIHRIPRDEVPRERSAVEGEGFTATFASFDASTREDTWHHHGDHDIIAYLLTGSISIETLGEGVIQMQPGDLVHIERGPSIGRSTMATLRWSALALGVAQEGSRHLWATSD